LTNRDEKPGKGGFNRAREICRNKALGSCIMDEYDSEIRLDRGSQAFHGRWQRVGSIPEQVTGN